MDKVGADDFLEGGGNLNDLPEQKIKVAFNPVKLAEEISENVIFSGDSFYVWERNETQGGVYKKVSDQEIEKLVMEKLKYGFRKAKSSEVLHAIKTAKAVHPDKFNDFRGMLNLTNGVFDPASGKIRPCSKMDLFSIQLPVAHDPGADCPLWKDKVREIFEGSEDDLHTFQAFCGYSLLKSTKAEKALVLIGDGNNGKSVLAKGFQLIFGNENITSLSLSRLADSRFTGMLYGKALNITTESSAKAKDWSENLKTAVSGEFMVSDEKYKDRFVFEPHAKHVIIMNEFPYMEDKSRGVTRRLLLIELKNNFEDVKDEDLKDKLVSEATGIFNWFLEGMKLYATEGFKESEEAKERLSELKTDSDSVLSFIRDECDTETSFVNDMEPQPELYKAYQEYCKDNGFQGPVSCNRFAKTLIKQFGCSRYRSHGIKYLSGIKLNFKEKNDNF